MSRLGLSAQKGRAGNVSIFSMAIAVIALCAATFAVGWKLGHKQKAQKVKQQMAVEKSVASAVLKQERNKDLDDIRILSEVLEPRLKSEKSQIKIAHLLRNLIYTRVPGLAERGVRFEGYNWLRLGDTYRKSVLDPTYGHMCGGRTIVYLIALRAFDLTARKAGIYPRVAGIAKDMAASHASVEVLIDGRWLAQDPSFNFSLTDRSGRPIGWVEAAKLLKRGETIFHPTDGYAIWGQRSVEHFEGATGRVLRDLIVHVNTSPYWDGTSTQAATKFPEEWDGNLRFSSGRVAAVFSDDSKNIYELLSQPLN